MFEQDFESTPESFANWAVLSAAIEAQWTFKGDEEANNNLERRAAKAYLTFLKEHMSNKDYNLITSSRLVDRSTNPSAVS